MAPDKERVRACLRGAVLADAASMGTHWIYDPAELKEQVKATPDVPEFFTPPNPRFYGADEFPGHYLAGMPSPYGELLLFGIGYCANQQSPDESVDAAKLLGAKYEWATTYGGRQDHALKTVLENVEKAGKDFSKPCGADDDQAMTYMKAVPMAALYAGKPDLLDNVDTAVRVHQDNDLAVHVGQASAMLVEHFLLGNGGTVRAAVDKLKAKMAPEVVEAVDATLKAVDDEKATVETLMSDLPGDTPFPFKGRSCQLPPAFMVPLFVMMREEAQSGKSDDEVFTSAVRHNILAAGDNCSRSVLLGAMLGAKHGAVPRDLTNKVETNTMSKADADITTIVEK